MITLKGESILMNNLYKETKNYLKYLAVGNSDTTPTYTDTSLSNEITRMEATISYNPNLKALIVIGDFEVSEIEDACEIGVFTNQNDLVSHDLFNSLPSGYDSTIHLEYRFNLDPFYKVVSWKTTGYDNVYVSLVDNVVQAVFERTTNAGYSPQKSLDGVYNNNASFYYDTGSKQLFIHTSMSVEPSALDIHILTR